MDYKLEAQRQYRHNNSDEFVRGYDVEVIDRYVEQLRADLELQCSYNRETEELTGENVKLRVENRRLQLELAKLQKTGPFPRTGE